MLAFLFGRKRKKVVKLPNNKRGSKTLKGYNATGLGATVAVKINGKIKHYRLTRVSRKGKKWGPGKFRVKIGKKYYTFKSKGPGTRVTLRRK
jgi:hypothetical protein